MSYRCQTREKKSDFIAVADKDKLLTKADALAIFATKADLANVRADLIKWMFIFWVGQIGVTVAIFNCFL